MDEGTPVGHHHTGQTESEEDGDGASDNQKNDLFKLDLFAIHPQHRFQKMHRPPLYDPKATAVEDMNQEWGQKGRSTKNQAKVQEIHQREGRAPRFRIAK
jgi:hypothetical protein